jgi:hypothetical protein
MTELENATRQKDAWAAAVRIHNDDAHDIANPQHIRTASTRAEQSALREWDYWRAIERDWQLTLLEETASALGMSDALTAPHRQ